MSANLGLVADAAERQAIECPAHGAGDRFSERSLAGTRRTDEAEDRAARLGLELADRQELQDAVLDDLKIVVVLVQDPARLGKLDLVLALLRPGKCDQPVEVGTADDVLRRGRGHRAQAVQLAVGGLPGLRRHAGLLDLLLQLLDRDLIVVVRPQLLLDRLELLAQHELALPLLHLVLDFLLNLAAQLQHLDLAAEMPGQLQEALVDRQSLQILLLGRRVAHQEDRRQIRQARRALDVQQGDADLLGGDRHERQHPAHEVLEVLDERLDLDRLFDPLAEERDLGRQVRLAAHHARQPDTVEAADQDPDRAIGEFQQALDDGDGADGVQVVLFRLFDAGVFLQDQSDEPILHHDVVDQLDGRRPPHHERRGDVREHDGVLQGHDREDRRQRPGRAHGRALLFLQRVQDGRFALALLGHAGSVRSQVSSIGTLRAEAGPRGMWMYRKPSV